MSPQERAHADIARELRTVLSYRSGSAGEGLMMAVLSAKWAAEWLAYVESKRTPEGRMPT